MITRRLSPHFQRLRQSWEPQLRRACTLCLRQGALPILLGWYLENIAQDLDSNKGFTGLFPYQLLIIYLKQTHTQSFLLWTTVVSPTWISDRGCLLDKGSGYSHQRPLGLQLSVTPLFYWVWTQLPETMPMKLSHSVVSKWLKHFWTGTIEMMDCYGLPS